MQTKRPVVNDGSGRGVIRSNGLLLTLVVLALVSCNERQQNIRLKQAPKVDADYAFAMVKKVTQLGPHPSGSAGAKKAVDLLKQEATAIGLEAKVDEWQDDTPNGKTTFRNVIVDLPGESSSFIILGSHYDSKILATVPEFAGANDGGSSTGLLLAIMRAIKEYPTRPPVTVRCVFFDGEECVVKYSDKDGLYGSRRYLAQLKKKGEIPNCKAVVVLDMIGDKDLTVTLSPNSNKAMADHIFRIAAKNNWQNHFKWLKANIHDDHVPFQNVGIPAIDLIDFEFGPNNLYWHTRGDTMDKISKESLRIVGDTTLQLIWDLPQLQLK